MSLVMGRWAAICDALTCVLPMGAETEDAMTPAGTGVASAGTGAGVLRRRKWSLAFACGAIRPARVLACVTGFGLARSCLARARGAGTTIVGNRG
ncbi:MAG: hypothetical protein ACK5JM_03025 [Rhodoblastus sp.]